MDLRSPRSRLLVIATLTAVWTGAVLGRLAYLQLVCYKEYYARAQRQQQRIVEIGAHRAEIYDRNMNVLAMSIPMESCFAVPSEIADPHMVARLLSKVLRVSPAEIATRLASSRSFVWIVRKLPPAQAERIAALNLRGIYFQQERGRFYPKRDLAAHVLGYVDIDEKGLGGIEYSLDRLIRSKPRKMLILADAHRRWYESSESGRDTGTSIILTLDQNIQYIAEKELYRAIRETHAKSGIVVVQNPNTGELLAVANWPTFNPNAVSQSPPEARMDRAISALYEPGSVFKIVTLSAAINQGLVTRKTLINCQEGAIYIDGHRIRDHAAFGMLTVSQILIHSSDVGAIKIGLRLGAPEFYHYIRAFGFGQITGIDLPGESRGLLRPLNDWTPVSVGSISMGQEIGVTAVQLVTAMSAMANGGLIIPPRIVEGFRHGSQTVEVPPRPARRVINETTAATMRRMLERVVLDGTGKLARLDGYTSAGKTGTAQKFDVATGHYSQHNLIASFVGFAPINNPAITILVTLDSPVGPHEGGEVAAPVFRRIAQQTLSYLRIPHDVPVSEQTAQTGRRRRDDPELSDLSDFNSLQSEVAVKPESYPHAGRANPEVHAATRELAQGRDVRVPRLQGKTVRGVTEACEKLGLSPILVGNGIAFEQSPEPGTVVPLGSRISVQFEREVPAVSVSAQGKNR